MPCRDEQPMHGRPSCAWENFKTPLLRTFPGDVADIVWEHRLGGGVDGYVWKIKWADHGPFALRVVSAGLPRESVPFDRHTYCQSSSGNLSRPRGSDTGHFNENAKMPPSSR